MALLISQQQLKPRQQASHTHTTPDHAARQLEIQIVYFERELRAPSVSRSRSAGRSRVARVPGAGRAVRVLGPWPGFRPGHQASR